ILGVAVVAFSNLELGSTSAGIYRTNDQGEFEKLTNIEGTTKRSLTINPQRIVFFEGDSQVMYTYSQTQGVYQSENGGDSWKQIFNTSKQGIRLTNIAVHPRNQDIIYAGGQKRNRARVYKTEDGGETWLEVYVEPVPNAQVRGMVINADDPDQITVALNTGVLLRTNNAGSKWFLLANRNELVPQDLRAHPQNDNIVYLITDPALHVSTNNGKSFVRRKFPIEDPSTIRVNPNDGDQIYVGGMGELYRTLDRGKTWNELDILTPNREGLVRSIAIAPENSRVIYYGIRNVLYFSEDGGRSWRTRELNLGGNIIDQILIDPANRDTLFLGVR
ncbi:MAG: WD40/YVTN/BNR-like repeat-containing protein, partial [Candidatus Paceibacteria bacterium]